MGVANTRKDDPGGPGDQPLNFGSSRGDPDPRRSVDDRFTIDYGPTLSAPGTNIRSARALNGVAQATCGASAELPSCIPANPQYEPFYTAISGTSMAAPHVTGAIAVLQGAARAKLGRRLSPDEVEKVLTGSAARMTKLDALYDFPCGSVPGLDCGTDTAGTTGAPYAPWQVGAGALNLNAGLASLAATPKPTPPPPAVIPAGPKELPPAPPPPEFLPPSPAAVLPIAKTKTAAKKKAKKATCKRRKGETKKRAAKRCAAAKKRAAAQKRRARG
jgi:subtilisin family serine protease